MATVKTEHPHIVRTEGVCAGDPIIKGTRIPVWAIAGWLKQGYSLQSIGEEIYPRLSLAELHDAVSYYYDHQDDIEAQLKANSPGEEEEEELEERRKQWAKLTQKDAGPSSSS